MTSQLRSIDFHHLLGLAAWSCCWPLIWGSHLSLSVDGFTIISKGRRCRFVVTTVPLYLWPFTFRILWSRALRFGNDWRSALRSDLLFPLSLLLRTILNYPEWRSLNHRQLGVHTGSVFGASFYIVRSSLRVIIFDNRGRFLPLPWKCNHYRKRQWKERIKKKYRRCHRERLRRGSLTVYLLISGSRFQWLATLWPLSTFTPLRKIIMT